MQYSASHLRQLAQGNWVGILAAAGLPSDLLDGRGHACPKCGGRDRFASFPGVDQRGAVHCRHCFTRGTAPSPGDGIATLMWLHNTNFATALRWLADHLGVAAQNGSSHSAPFAYGTTTRSISRSKTPAPSAALIHKMTSLARDAMMRIQALHFDQLHYDLGVPVTCLRSLCVGYSADHRATTWPMRSSDGRITGIRLRSIGTSTKWSVKDSVAGLFLSRDHKPVGDQLVIVEGASDMAAAIDLGMTAIGRPSCRGCVRIVADYIRRHGFRSATIVSDNDAAGRSGANALAKDLARSGVSARVISPPAEFNDLRSWHRHGVSRDEILNRPSISQHPGVCLATQLSFSFASNAASGTHG